MPLLATLLKSYHEFDDKRRELDMYCSTLPYDDINGRDLALVELDTVMSSLIDTERQMSLIPATDPSGLRAKAEVLSMAHRDDESRLALSLAQDVVMIFQAC